MKETQFSTDFLAKLGVQAWQENSAFVKARSLKTPPKPQTDFVATDIAMPKFEASDADVTVIESKPLPQNDSLMAAKVQLEKVPFIVIGAELSRFWQNDDALEWQLWKNITEVFAWDIEQIPFYDTLHLVSEEAILATLEEVMEMDVDWVLSMDTESVLAEHLQEGLRVQTCPSLSDMLSDPLAKKSFYQLMQATADSFVV